MKKIISLLLVILFCIGILTGCGIDTSNSELKCIEQNTIDYDMYDIYYDKETGVMYIMNREGGVTVMLNADGSPKIYNK